MNYTLKIQQLLSEHANEENAFPMEKYMRNRFPFLGIKTPLRRKLMQQFYRESGIKKEGLQSEFIRSLWQLEGREYQYAALDYLNVSLKKLQKDDLALLEELITTKSWWDTVDTVAPKSLGVLASRYPEIIEEKIEKWVHSDNIWLQRSAILFQLKYKEQTDEALLYRYIKTLADSKEFFIQKAIGWALREYSKTNPTSVRIFIETEQLPKLSVREGSKYI